MHYVYNPVGLDPSTVFPRLEDYVRLFVHIVIATQSKYQENEEGWVPLHSITLRKQVHRDRTEAIRESLVNRKVIECDKKYYPEEKCYGFRMAPAWRNKRIERVPVAIPQRRINLLEERGYTNQPDLPKPVHEAIWHWLNLTEVDYDAARLHLEKQEETEDNLLQKWFTLEKLRLKDLFFHVDDQGRVYHNVACLWSQFRQFLTIKGKKLVNVDIKNSQPLFFAIKLREHHNPYHHPFLYYSVAQTSKRELADDVKLYIELVEQGKLYDYLMEEFGHNNYKSFKKKFFALFYSKPNTERKLNKAFRRIFPNVFDVICELKKNDYRDLPIEMQRIEASLMIGQVGTRLAKEGIPFLTIHDSIMTIPECVNFVQNVIQEAFLECYGLTPTIKCHE